MNPTSKQPKMDLEFFLEHYKNDVIGQSVALYIIASKNLSPQYQKQNFCRCGVAGSREVANIRLDRSATAAGGEAKASSLHTRCGMYLANSIQSMDIIAVLLIPRSVVNRPTGPTITRILETRNPGDNRPDYALRGKTMAITMEALFHSYIDQLPDVSRARRKTEWFKSRKPDFSSLKLALQAVGNGTYIDFTKHPNAMPGTIKGQKLGSGMLGRKMGAVTHPFRTSPRLDEMIREGVKDVDGNISLSHEDIEDIRISTPRGLRILDMITRRERATQTTQTETENNKTKNITTPTTVRMTRSGVEALRAAALRGDDIQLRRSMRNLGN
jgi:hypothetical protein